MKSFFEDYNLKSLIKPPTSHLNWDNPTCVDLILPRDLQNTWVIETGLPGCFDDTWCYQMLFHPTVMIKSFKKSKLKLMTQEEIVKLYRILPRITYSMEKGSKTYTRGRIWVINTYTSPLIFPPYRILITWQIFKFSH